MALVSLAQTLNFHEHIDGYPPNQLFEHGRDASLVPTPPGFELYVDGGVFSLGAEVSMKLKKLGIGYEGSVDECSLESGIAISGLARPLGRAEMWLSMNPGKRSGTTLEYGIRLTASNIGLYPLLIGATRVLKAGAENFVAQYRENVILAIQNA